MSPSLQSGPLSDGSYHRQNPWKRSELTLSAHLARAGIAGECTVTRSPSRARHRRCKDRPAITARQPLGERGRARWTGSLPRTPGASSGHPSCSRSSPRATPARATTRRRTRTPCAPPSRTSSQKQVDAGIDVVDDGEMGKTSWITYLYERVQRLEARLVTLEGASMLPPSRDRQQFPGAYAELDALDEAATRSSNIAPDGSTRDDGVGGDELGQVVQWVCTGPITYDRSALDRDIANLRAALEGHPDIEAFLPGRGAGERLLAHQRALRQSEEEFVYALADALHEEYKAIVDAGLPAPGRRRRAHARVGHDALARAERRRLPQVGPAPRRRAQPRAARAARGPGPLPRVLGQLAWPARV